MVRLDAIAEEMLPAPQDDGEEEEPELVHEVVLEEPVDEVGAAVDEQVTLPLRLEPPDLLGQVAAKEEGVRQLGPDKGLRHDVLRNVDDPLLEPPGVGAGAPERRPDLVGRPSEEQCGGALRVLLVEALELIIADPQGPRVPPVAVLLEPGRLHDPVDRQEVGDHEPHRSTWPVTRAAIVRADASYGSGTVTSTKSLADAQYGSGHSSRRRVRRRARGCQRTPPAAIMATWPSSCRSS